MARITFTYSEDSDSNLTERIKALGSAEGTFWYGRSISVIAKELVKKAIDEVEKEVYRPKRKS